jgi:hypothetical protein
MATLAPPSPTTTGFPKTEVLAALTAELIQVATSEAAFRKIQVPSDPAQVLTVAVPMDSLTVVDAICALETIVKFELKDRTVRTGGYNSIQEALDHLMPRIERAWVRKNKGQKNGSAEQE